MFTGKALLPGDYLSQMHPWADQNPQDAKAIRQWNPLAWDAISQFYPWRVFYARSLSSGKIPLDNPHQFSGTPFQANGQSAVLDPFNLLFLIFSPITAITIFAFIHLFLAQVFSYWFLKELQCRAVGAIIGAVCFAFSAFMVCWLELPTFISAACFLPLVLLLSERAIKQSSLLWASLAGGALALSILAGHLQIAFYVSMAAFIWWFYRLIELCITEGLLDTLKVFVKPAFMFVLVASLLACVQIIPSRELAKVSHRSNIPSEEGYNWFLGNSLKPYHLITAFIPNYYGSPADNNYVLLGKTDDSKHIASAADYMEYGMYFGASGLLLAVFGLSLFKMRRYVSLLSLISLLSLLIALGTSINSIFYFNIPGFSSLGGPNRILLLFIFASSMLAGIGADHLICNINEKRKHNWNYLFTILGILSAYFITSSIANNYTLSKNLSEFIHPSIAPLGIIAGIILMALMASYKLISKNLFAILLLVICICDVFAFGINYNPVCDPKLVYPKTELTTYLQENCKGKRVAFISSKWSLFDTPTDALMPPNAATVYGINDVAGYDSLYLMSYRVKLADVIGADPSPMENGNIVSTLR